MSKYKDKTHLESKSENLKSDVVILNNIRRRHLLIPHNMTVNIGTMFYS